MSELIDAFEFGSFSDRDEHQAYICRRTGRIIYVSNAVDIEEETEFPDDHELADYPSVPNRRDLDLDRRLALSFVAEELADAFDNTTQIFR